MSAVHAGGIEWLIDAHGCPAKNLRSLTRLRRLFESIVRELDLHPVGESAWRRFPSPGGLTGFWMLKESHLACHTFPEHGSICVNLFCCRPRPVWDWEHKLRTLLGASDVSVRSFLRRYEVSSSESRVPISLLSNSELGTRNSEPARVAK